MLLFFYATIPLSPAKKNAGAAEQFFHGGGEAAADGGTGREAPPPLLSRPAGRQVAFPQGRPVPPPANVKVLCRILTAQGGYDSLILKNYRWRFNPNFRILFCERRLALNHHLQFILAAARPMAAGNSFFNNDTRTVPPCPRMVHTRAIIPFPQQNTAAPCAYFPPMAGFCAVTKLF
jgi:hypothetical protein